MTQGLQCAFHFAGQLDQLGQAFRGYALPHQAVYLLAQLRQVSLHLIHPVDGRGTDIGNQLSRFLHGVEGSVGNAHAVEVLGRLIQSVQERAIHYFHAGNSPAVFSETVPQVGEHLDQRIYVILIGDLSQQVTDFRKDVFDQHTEVLHLYVVLCGGGGGGADLIGNGIGLGILIKDDGRLPVFQSGSHIMHIAGEVFVHHQRPVVAPGADALNGFLRVFHDDPVYALRLGDLLNDRASFVYPFPLLGGITPVTGGQRDRHITGVGIGIAVGIDIYPSVKRRYDQNSQRYHDGKEASAYRAQVRKEYSEYILHKLCSSQNSASITSGYW